MLFNEARANGAYKLLALHWLLWGRVTACMAPDGVVSQWVALTTLKADCAVARVEQDEQESCAFVEHLPVGLQQG